MTIQLPERNPFDTPLARDNNSYAAFRGKALVALDSTARPPSPLAEFVHDSFRALVLSPKFSCLGAKSAIQRGNYRIGMYADMASTAASAGLAYDLYRFVRDQAAFRGFSTFVASFAAPVIGDELHFEQLLWSLLQRLHDLDHRHHRWDPQVSADPEQADFSFSFAQHGFFVVGLHPASSRWARRFAWPTLVFNAHAQFEDLRASGRFHRMQAAIREREQALQGTINANLSDFGERSEARQYSGRAVEDDWRCPFHPHRD